MERRWSVKMVRELVRRLKNDGEKMVSEDGPRELARRLNKDGEKMISEDVPKKLVRRLNNDEKMVRGSTSGAISFMIVHLYHENCYCHFSNSYI